jgi:hypothetical protein
LIRRLSGSANPRFDTTTLIKSLILRFSFGGYSFI